MKQLTSADFRKSYATLTEAVEVTALGRPIGHWVPIGAAYDRPLLQRVEPATGGNFNSRGSQPVPKTRGK